MPLLAVLLKSDQPYTQLLQQATGMSRHLAIDRQQRKDAIIAAGNVPLPLLKLDQLDMQKHAAGTVSVAEVRPASYTQACNGNLCTHATGTQQNTAAIIAAVALRQFGSLLESDQPWPTGQLCKRWQLQRQALLHVDLSRSLQLCSASAHYLVKITAAGAAVI